MFRLRRYRIFVALAAITVFLLYRFSQPSQWQDATLSAAAFRDRLGLGLHRPPPSSSGSQDGDKGRKVYSSSGNGVSEAKAPPAKADEEAPNPPKIPAKQPDKVPPPATEDVPKPVQGLPPPHAGVQKPQEGGIHNAGGRVAGGAAQAPSQTVKQPIEPWPPQLDDPDIVLVPGGQARQTIDGLPTNGPKERWTKLPEHYPVPTESIIPLPTGKGKPIPRIQHQFGTETAEEKTLRTQRLETVKEAFLHAWNGYKTRAWGKDELRPVTGQARNTFNGWSATLVDALDTMWIMGLKKEFEEGVEFVKSIDFYASTKTEIPVFETTIRYLGGLLGAYDVSNGKYPVLLDRARDLGDMLMAAFDTPNRMPLTYYPWKAAFASQPHRSSRAVLAEIGSLQMEFTRLAQLTGNSSYYDAITRIVDALDEFQNNTTIPGIWPADVDTSGCAPYSYHAPSRNPQNTFTYSEKSDFPPPMEPLQKPPPIEFKEAESQRLLPSPFVVSSKLQEFVPLATSDAKLEPLKKPDPVVFQPKNSVPQKEVDHQLKKRQSFGNQKDQVPEPGLPASGQAQGLRPVVATVPEEQPCTPFGLYSASGYEKYTFGSTADSAFEYLTKQHLLLSGQVDKYRTMYEKAIDAANDNLIFRVMTKDEKRELYVAGEVHVSTYGSRSDRTFHTEQTHLVCFVGGMFALGAKVFDRPKDLDIAAKLTDGCVWSYESFASGIMPETFEVVKCDSRKECAWNETRWHYELDPNAELRMEMYESQMENYRFQLQQLAAYSAAEAAARPTEAPVESADQIIPNDTGPARAVVTEAQDSAREPPAGFNPLYKPDAQYNKKFNKVKRQNDLQSYPSPLPLAKDSTPDWPAPARPDEIPETPITPNTPNTPSTPNTPDTLNSPDTLGSPATPTIEESTFHAPDAVYDVPPPVWSPTKPQTREEYASMMIRQYRLKPGMKSMRDPRYLLRPEAIESVFYMHRITGDPYWRTAGWRMVSAVLTATRTQYGHAAIRDVTQQTPVHNDEMESFWLAETLKYAWLLFEDEGRWSLDEWVLNTEAHLFRRPPRVA